MALRRTCAAAISIAVILSCAAFPGGAFLCREASGDVNLEPFHAPHASSCVPDECRSEGADASSVAHRHERCTDTEISGLQAPVHTMKLRPAVALGPAASDLTAKPSLAVDRAAGERSAAPPPPSDDHAAVLRI